MSGLIDKKCQACEGGIPALTKSECDSFLKETPDWQLSNNNKYISKSFSFKGFYAVMGFINAMAYIVQKEGHHPEVEFGFNYCRVKFTTHAIDGLTENDFICAAKIDALFS